MDVFISWAGTRSFAVAEALKDWIPMLINAAQPWLSKAHIPAGRLWRAELAERLSLCKFGIFCLTPQSLSSNWMFFEAGAISKTLADSHVCPLLIDLKPSDVSSPFADFQCRALDKSGILALRETLNEAIPDGRGVSESQLHSVFDLLWPRLETRLSALPADEDKLMSGRRPDDILEELLTRIRTIEQQTARPLAPDDRRNNIEATARKATAVANRLKNTFPSVRARVLDVDGDTHIDMVDGDGNSIMHREFSAAIPTSDIINCLAPEMEAYEGVRQHLKGEFAK